MKRLRGSFLAVCVLAVVGCGNPGPTQPPSLHLPLPVDDLAASRVGNRVVLRWTMSRRTTDKLLLDGDQRVQVCRGGADAPCLVVAETRRPAGTAAEFDDTLASPLTAGPPSILRYEIRLLNRSNRTAGGSNPAYALAGAAPPQAAAVRAVPTAEGVLVRWDTTGLTPGLAPGLSPSPVESAQLFVQLTRTRVLRKGEPARPTSQQTAAGVPVPAVETMEAPEHTLAIGGWAPDQLVDTHAVRGLAYEYAVQLIAREKVAGHILEISGLRGSSLPVLNQGSFPPAAPANLSAAANPAGGTIDLSWTPSTSDGVTGYRVYRRTANSAAPPVCISGSHAVAVPGWSDPSARPGVRYAYSVAAVDAAGDASSRSAEAEAELPARNP